MLFLLLWLYLSFNDSESCVRLLPSMDMLMPLFDVTEAMLALVVARVGVRLVKTTRLLVDATTCNNINS